MCNHLSEDDGATAQHSGNTVTAVLLVELSCCTAEDERGSEKRHTGPINPCRLVDSPSNSVSLPSGV